MPKDAALAICDNRAAANGLAREAGLLEFFVGTYRVEVSEAIHDYFDSLNEDAGGVSSGCQHDNVSWSPVEMYYQTDGTAAIWQEGRCSSCGGLVQLDYHSSEQGSQLVGGVDTVK
jgi:hypothetical protein